MTLDDTFVIFAIIFTSVCNAEICISRSSAGNNDAVFHGTYEEQIDSNDNTYYIKTDFCDTETSPKEYIYLNNGQWLVGRTLNSNTYSLLCASNLPIATPDQCPEWINGNAGIDPELKVESCADTETPSLSCNYIVIENSNFLVDGTYIKMDNNLYNQQVRPSITYMFQFVLQGGYYIIGTQDIRQSCDDPFYYLRSDDRSIDNLQHGDSITVPLIWPTSGSATIKCLENIPSPYSIQRVVMSGSLTDWNGNIPIPNSGYEEIDDEDEQNEIEDDLNSIKPELSVLFNFDYVYTIFLDIGTSPPWLPPPDPAIYCKDENDGSVSCRCKIKYHGPPPDPIEVEPGVFIHGSPPLYEGNLEYRYGMQGEGAICMSVVDVDATFIRRKPMRDMAGKYEVMDDLINYKPAYALTTDCGISMYIMYYIGFGRPYWLFVEDINDPRNTYQMWCQNTYDIIDNDITKCRWVNNDEFELSASNVNSCQCGQTV